MNRTPLETFKKLLGKYHETDTISVFELSRVFRRKSVGFQKDATQLCRYLVEPRTRPEVEFNECAENVAAQIFQRLFDTLGGYVVFTSENESEIRSTISSVIFMHVKRVQKLAKCGKELLEKLERQSETITYTELMKLLNKDVGLSFIEMDYIVLTIYKDTKDMNKLKCSPILDMIPFNKETSEPEEKPEPVEEKKQEVEEYPPDEEVPEDVNDQVVNPISENKVPESLPEEPVKSEVISEPAEKVKENNIVPSESVEEVKENNVVPSESIENIKENNIAPTESVEKVKENIVSSESIENIKESIKENLIAESAEELKKEKNKPPTEEVKVEPSDNYEEKFDAEDELAYGLESAMKDEPAPNEPKTDEKSKERNLESAPNEVANDEEVDIDEDQMIEIAQNAFNAIADQMLQKKLTIRELFSDTIQAQRISAEDVEVISSEDFVKGIRSLGITEIEGIHYACLIKVLSINEDQRFVKLGDLVQVLNDFGVPEAEAQAAESNKPRAPLLNFQDLDPISMVLMLAVTEYLIKTKMPLYDLFADVIYQQVVKTKSKQKTVELVNSTDFFAVLCKIGIKMEETEHENLKKFLCLDPRYLDKIYIKKLKAAINEFATNEELREAAQNCYKELIADQENDNPEAKSNDDEADEFLNEGLQDKHEFKDDYGGDDFEDPVEYKEDFGEDEGKNNTLQQDIHVLIISHQCFMNGQEAIIGMKIPKRRHNSLSIQYMLICIHLTQRPINSMVKRLRVNILPDKHSGLFSLQ
eukprot:TRINITY_DN136_c0_g4_i1.p3 TRINITY_DN136_c0_g4~~TRINITY_DN136_c0_g4_i1.p3  ORF type:complete len:761 (-),score=136.43 TRINITY_DN136_c0_g4_i1:30204-32486(-)